ncbi:serine hydrolase [Thermobrachium celere]|uniref:Beta-lactamase n=1 Tax=Thermobrachium celere DSM 8682 TaxID=941824 RepID=R7RQN3_9CLOT|nr:serine hydrolase [Thermobrachium celere]CDF57545.1 Beta-lactamase [Thermobrachium celere DSM 8682]
MKNVLDYIDRLNCSVGVYYKELETQYMFEYNSDKIFPSASTIKVPILLALFNKVLKGEIDLNKRIKIQKDYTVSGAGIVYLLDENNTYTLLDLAKLMIVLSDNTATNIIIDLLGFEYINKYFKEIGLNETILQRKMMDFDRKRLGFDNFTSARDLGLTFYKLCKKEVLNPYYCNLAIEILKEQKLKGGLDRYLGNKYEIAHKTGELNNLEHDCGIVFKDHKTFIVVILTEGEENYILKDVIGNITSKLIKGSDLNEK